MKRSPYTHKKKISGNLLITLSILPNINIVALLKVPQPGIAYLDIAAYLNRNLKASPKNLRDTDDVPCIKPLTFFCKV